MTTTRRSLRGAGLCLLLGPASAVAAGFEDSLASLRCAAAGALASQAEFRGSTLLQEVQQAAKTARRKSSRQGSLRSELRDLTRRARFPEGDPFHLDGDLRTFILDLQEQRGAVASLSSTVHDLKVRARPDPALVKPAEELLKDARSLRSTAGWLASEARQLARELARIGRPARGSEIEWLSDDIARFAADLEAASAGLLKAVRVQEPLGELPPCDRVPWN